MRLRLGASGAGVAVTRFLVRGLRGVGLPAAGAALLLFLVPPGYRVRFCFGRDAVRGVLAAVRAVAALIAGWVFYLRVLAVVGGVAGKVIWS